MGGGTLLSVLFSAGEGGDWKLKYSETIKIYPTRELSTYFSIKQLGIILECLDVLVKEISRFFIHLLLLQVVLPLQINTNSIKPTWAVVVLN